LESRLEKANHRFNEAVNANKTLREQIDGLRRERVIFESIYKRLEGELQKKRKDMANIIEIANSAYEERDKAQEKLALLMKRAEREAAANSDLILSGLPNQDLTSLTSSLLNKQDGNNLKTNNNPSSVEAPGEHMDEEA
jgi:chromosome segregation ATPase